MNGLTILLQASLYRVWGWIPAYHAYQKDDYDDVCIRYYIDHGQYLSFIPAPDEPFTFDREIALLPIKQPEIWLWRDNDFLSAR
ncbi:MAG: hypothetical protein ACL7BU_15645 [Candidatus Phlomobacter fragariae]